MDSKNLYKTFRAIDLSILVITEWRGDPMWIQWDLNLSGKRVQLVFLKWDQGFANCLRSNIGLKIIRNFLCLCLDTDWLRNSYFFLVISYFMGL
jgi:hypothetical protein